MNDLDTYYSSKYGFVVKNFSDLVDPHTPTIDESISQAGVFTRYFVHFVSTPNMIVEINQNTFNKLSKNSFYITVKLSWFIRGPKQTVVINERESVGVIDANKESVKQALLTMPSLSSYLTDYTQFWQQE